MKKIFAFIAAVVISTLFSACGGDNPSDSDPEPEFDFSGDLIAFRSDREGSELINITNDPANDSDRSWASDGSEIASVSPWTGNAKLNTPGVRNYWNT